MEYINATTDEVAKKSQSPRIKKIHDRVCNVKKSEKVGVKLMQAWEELYYERLEAKNTYILEKIKIKMEKGKSLEDIAEDLDEDIKVIKSIAVENLLVEKV